MAKKPDSSKRAIKLREQAEAQLRLMRTDVTAIPVKDLHQLVHELQVHQIELEMQNEELRRTQVELEIARDRYVDLYDGAPIGYLTLDSTGMILAANMPACTVLGVNRKSLLRKSVLQFVAAKDQAAWLSHFRKLFSTGARQVCDVELAREGGVSVQFESVTVRDEAGLMYQRTVLSDITAQRQARAALKESEQRLNYTLNATSLWDWNIKTGVVLFSPAWISSLGYEPDEVPPNLDFWKSIVHPDDLPSTMAALQAHLDRRTPVYHCENRLRLKSGQYRYNVDHGSVVEWNADGSPLRMVGTDIDITTRKQAEHRLATQYTVVQMLAESATLKEASTNILSALGTCLGSKACAMWKIDHRANLLRCIHTWQASQMETSEFLVDSLQRTFAQGAGIPGRAWSHGEPLWIPDIFAEASCPRAPLAAKAGLASAVSIPIKTKENVYGVIEIFNETTAELDVLTLQMLNDIGCKIGQFLAHKETEELLQSANKQLAEIVRATAMVVIAVDVENRVLAWNPAAERLFGWTAAEVLGKPLPTIPEDKRDQHAAMLRQVLAGKAIAQCDVERKTKNGTTILMSCAKSPLWDEHHVPIGMSCIGVDITEQKWLETQAKRLDRLATLGQLLSGIAHELKNPLFIITGRLYLLNEDLQGQATPEIATNLTAIAGAVERMTKIVERFLQLARPIVPAKVLVSMEDIIRQTLDFLANELMKNQITVVQDFAPDLPQIWTDPNQIHGVLLNLCLNAIQAMTDAHGRGTLTVTTALMPSGPASDSEPLSGQGPWIEIRIHDDGPGVPAEHQAKLFEPFFSTKAAGNGTGLGLWIVRSTVVALHGTAHYDNSAGQGATFVVRLPVESPESEAADPPPPAPIQSNS